MASPGALVSLRVVARLFFGLLAAQTAGSIALGTEFNWTDDDWSGQGYAAVQGVNPEICPGRLVLENDLSDLRYLASPTQYQGLYSMVAYRDTLFLTASDYPYMFDGADVIAYDYLTNRFAVVYQPYESGLHLIKSLGDTLYVPGPDSMDPWSENGSLYTYDGDTWRELATLPWAVHVCDVDRVGRTLYATTGHIMGGMSGKGCVWRSTDWGETFVRVLSIDRSPEREWRRFFGVGHIGDRIFAQPDGFPPESNVVYTSLDGEVWETIPMPNHPVDRQAVFTEWNGELLMTVENRLYIWKQDHWVEHQLPFHGWRWCRGIHGYEGELYGGGDTCRLFRWQGGSSWASVGRLPADSTTTEIESMVTYYGRLYVSTSRIERGMPPGVYVSAALPSGSLDSEPHDFGSPVRDGTLRWSQHRPTPGDLAQFQVRSAGNLLELQLRPFIGPDGTTASFYIQSGAALASVHDGDRFIQYRVELRSANGLSMPILESVTLEVESDDDPSALPDPLAVGPGFTNGLLRVDRPRPNPATVEASIAIQLAPGFATRWGEVRGLVHVRVHDVRGNAVRGEVVQLPSAGEGAWLWDLRDDAGRSVPQGRYWLSVRLADDPTVEVVRAVDILR